MLTRTNTARRSSDTRTAQDNNQSAGTGVSGARSSPSRASSQEEPPEGDPIRSGNMGASASASAGNRPGSSDRASGTGAEQASYSSDSNSDSDYEDATEDWGPNSGWEEPSSLLGWAAYNAASIAAIPIILGWRLAEATPTRVKQALMLASLPMLAGTVNRGTPVKDTKTPTVGIILHNKDNKTAVACSGVMLDNDTVLTAQHCVLDLVEITTMEGDPCPEPEESSGSGSGAGALFIDDEDGEASVEDEEGSGSAEAEYGDYSYDYGGDGCGQYEVTTHNTSVASPDRVWVYRGLHDDNITHAEVEKIIVRHGFDYNDETTLVNDLAILKLKPGKDNALGQVHYPHLQNEREYRKFRKDSRRRDEKWNQRYADFDRYFSERDAYQKSNGTLPTPKPIKPFKTSKTNARVEGWGVKKTDLLLQMEESGDPIPFEMINNRTSVEELLKGGIGIRDFRNTNVTGNPYKNCDSKLFCQEYMYRSKGACAGDSGGPLYQKPRNPDNRETLMGITSRSDCGTGGRFVNLRSHQRWIRRHMSNPPPEPPDTSSRRRQRPSSQPTASASPAVDINLPQATAASGAVPKRRTTTQPTTSVPTATTRARTTTRTTTTTTTETTTTTPRAPRTEQPVRFKDNRVRFGRGQHGARHTPDSAPETKGKGYWKGQSASQHRSEPEPRDMPEPKPGSDSSGNGYWKGQGARQHQGD